MGEFEIKTMENYRCTIASILIARCAVRMTTKLYLNLTWGIEYMFARKPAKG